MAFRVAIGSITIHKKIPRMGLDWKMFFAHASLYELCRAFFADGENVFFGVPFVAHDNERRIVAGDGFEPSTFRLWAWRATTALPRDMYVHCMKYFLLSIAPFYKSFVSKSYSWWCFEVFFKIKRWFFFIKSTIVNQFPRCKFAGMWRPTSIMIYYSLFQIFSKSSVYLIWLMYALNNVYVEHRNPW